MNNCPSEKNILEKISRNPSDESIIEDILTLYQKRIYWIIRPIVLVHEDADDILQEVMIKVWLNLSRFKGDSSLFTWICRIAINESLQHIRRKKIRTFENSNGTNLPSETLKTDPYFNGNTLEMALYDAVSMLPEKQRMVFILRYFQNLPYEGISRITGASEGALKANFHHALEKVESNLKQKAENLIL